MNGIFGCLSTEWIGKLSKSLQLQGRSERKRHDCQMPKHTNNATAVIEDHASLQSNFTGVLKHGSGKTLTVGKHTKKLDNRAHLAIILLVEESMCLLRYGRARHDHLHDLTILAALLAQVLYYLEGST